jgi:hypothetical protein
MLCTGTKADSFPFPVTPFPLLQTAPPGQSWKPSLEGTRPRSFRGAKTHRNGSSRSSFGMERECPGATYRVIARGLTEFHGRGGSVPGDLPRHCARLNRISWEGRKCTGRPTAPLREAEPNFMGEEEVYRATYCAHTSPLPLLPSGPGGVGGITSRRTRHKTNHTIANGPANHPAP